jgi:hypothetical protein
MTEQSAHSREKARRRRPLWLATGLAVALAASAGRADTPPAAKPPAAKATALEPPVTGAAQTLRTGGAQVTRAVQDYLDMVGAMRAAAVDPIVTQIILQHEIKESYQRKGQPLEAVTEFRAQLESLKDPDARIAMRFAILDVYNASGKTAEALEEMRGILAENRKRLEGER